MKKLLLIQGFLLLALAGCAPAPTTTTYNVTTPPAQNVVQNPPAESTPTQPTTPTSNLQTYTNSTYHFHFTYPKEFNFVTANYGNLSTKIVQVQLSSAAYPKTNFGDAALTVSMSSAQNLEQCLNMNSPEGSSGFGPSPIDVNGVNFYLANGSGAGAGNLYEAKVYRTFRGLSCFEIAETLHTANIDNFAPGTVEAVNKVRVWERMNSIFTTFQFEN